MGLPIGTRTCRCCGDELTSWVPSPPTELAVGLARSYDRATPHSWRRLAPGPVGPTGPPLPAVGTSRIRQARHASSLSGAILCIWRRTPPSLPRSFSVPGLALWVSLSHTAPRPPRAVLCPPSHASTVIAPAPRRRALYGPVSPSTTALHIHDYQPVLARIALTLADRNLLNVPLDDLLDVIDIR
jgi:hypothetical protein